MRVLFLNYEYPPLGGGAGNATSYILREYAKIDGLQVDLVTSSVDNDFHLDCLGDNIKIHRLPIGKNKKNFHTQSQKDLLVYSWKAYWYSKKLIQENKYNLSHSFFTVPCGFLSMLFWKKYKVPYIVSLRGADVPGFSERFTSIYKILAPIIKTIWSKSFRVVSCSERLKELALKTKKNQKIEVIANGIDINQFKPKESESQENDGHFKVLCISRLTGRKGIGYLVSAMKEVSEKHSNIKLTVVGEGDAKVELQKKAKDLKIESFVEFLGLVDHEKIPELYRNADVFVLPSLNEGMSNTMLEALSSGLPIIATDTGGTKELVKNGENGFVVKMKNSRDIAISIVKLIEDRELCQKMASLSRNMAMEMSWENAAKKYYAIYKDIK